MRHSRPECLRRCAAFTLVEALAALLILALALTALQLRIAQQVDNAVYLRDKTVAGWVAQNQLERLRIASRIGAARLAEGAQGSTVMGSRTWFWVITPQAAAALQGASAPLTVVISVSDMNSDAARVSPLVSLTGVIDARP
jgi:type II secretion system protein I